jgi:hypothetical protein
MESEKFFNARFFIVNFAFFILMLASSGPTAAAAQMPRWPGAPGE